MHDSIFRVVPSSRYSAIPDRVLPTWAVQQREKGIIGWLFGWYTVETCKSKAEADEIKEHLEG
jgi:hypothetical protein